MIDSNRSSSTSLRTSLRSRSNRSSTANGRVGSGVPGGRFVLRRFGGDGIRFAVRVCAVVWRCGCGGQPPQKRVFWCGARAEVVRSFDRLRWAGEASQPDLPGALARAYIALDPGRFEASEVTADRIDADAEQVREVREPHGRDAAARVFRAVAERGEVATMAARSVCFTTGSPRKHRYGELGTRVRLDAGRGRTRLPPAPPKHAEGESRPCGVRRPGARSHSWSSRVAR